MKCPGCKADALVPSFLEDSFRARSCKSCRGSWILIEDFVYWSERNGPIDSQKLGVQYVPEDSKHALICPVTGGIMQKYRISNGSDHKLDYSPQVGGVWLDPGEWDYLKEQGLAGCIGSIFTDSWQKQLRDNNTKATFTALYQRKFGHADYEKIREVRQWLVAHPDRTELKAYLLTNDPYSVR